MEQSKLTGWEMAGMCCYGRLSQTLMNQKVQGFYCCSPAPNNQKMKTQTPKFLKVAVTGVTELLRLFTFSSPIKRNRLEISDDEGAEEPLVSNIEDVLKIIKSDYEQAYFVTGLFTSGIYAEDCIFEDPTIKFSGRDLYSRNLQLLVPFFDSPSIILEKIEKGNDSDTEVVVAYWKLRTSLKLPWRPLISVDGNTVYDLDEQFKIVKHVESWNISALEAVGQIFTPGLRSFSE
ncbi:uncharacterized protein LOC107830913 [Nicotiana tabacum]|uniref:Uncharacterized protein LOC107830913 n=1 Tax=Nicotiana tabacum TaxID=4097 RepID=A0A1S4DL18_TOBAC|nr:uncharacterized protein LOC104085988 [Nicotiana tomentosiformis]XP_016514083.1 PREDICTED: uncharacterized protein LOC107830913 [Nicotiana tabacum]